MMCPNLIKHSSEQVCAVDKRWRSFVNREAPHVDTDAMLEAQIVTEIQTIFTFFKRTTQIPMAIAYRTQ